MANLQEVPILDVSTENCREVWPAMVLAAKSATFVALDMASCPHSCSFVQFS